MADKLSDADKASMELHRSGAQAPAFIGDALPGGVFQSYTEFVATHATVPGVDYDGDGEADPTQTQTPIVPLYVYGDGPHDYISTDFDAGQVMVRDGNDPTGKAWKFDETAFRRYVARAQGKELPDDHEKVEGESPIEGAVRLARRTAERVQADRDATERAEAHGAPAQLEKVDRPSGGKAGTTGAKH
jgi:hypothetical protein